VDSRVAVIETSSESLYLSFSMDSPSRRYSRPSCAKLNIRRASKSSTGRTEGQESEQLAKSTPTGPRVQEADGSFFESFTALSWKQENRRLQSIRKDEANREKPPPEETSIDVSIPEFRVGKRDKEQLYVEVLYTVKYKLGATTGSYSPYTGDLFNYAQDAFKMASENHRRLLGVAQEEKPPILVLHIVVLEARGLEAKDPNGFSDPYCMLGIQPGRASTSPPAASGYDSEESNSKKGNFSGRFRASFKRKGSKKERHESGGNETVPAKFIRVTSVKPHSLNPKWNEKFRFDIDDCQTDKLHLDIWDHDDESSVLDAAKKLNEVSGLKGLGRFFKQVAQSARSSIGDSVDDFLGSVNIAVVDVPSIGSVEWYELEGRSQRSKIQGQIKLKLHLGTREDRGFSEEEDSWNEFWQHYSLVWIFVEYELSRFRGSICEWDGRLSPDACTILHQHAIQGDLAELHQAMCRWIAYSRKHIQVTLDYALLYSLLEQVDRLWDTDPLTREEEQSLAESFNYFIEYCLTLLKNIRELYPPNNQCAWYKLDYMLKCLCLIRDMKAYSWCCPFHKEIHTEITNAIKKGSSEWYEKMYEFTKPQIMSEETVRQSLIELVNHLNTDMYKNIEFYNRLFDGVIPSQYSSVVFRQLDRMSYEDLSIKVDVICKQISSLELFPDEITTENMKIGTSMFELYLALKEFVTYRDLLAENERRNVKFNNFHQWFKPVVSQWLCIARFKIMQRIRKAIQLDMVQPVDSYVKHSTSSVDTTTCFYQVKEFWKMLSWPDPIGAIELVTKVLDDICNGAMFYAQNTHQKLQEAGYYDDDGQFDASDQLCVTINNIEHVRQGMKPMAEELEFEAILYAVEKTQGDRQAQRCRASLYGMIHSTEGDVASKIQMIVHRVSVKMQPEIKKSVFHLACSPEAMSADDAIVPLMKYLDTNLIVLHKNLLQINFDRMLQAIWDVVVTELIKTTHGNITEKQTQFFKRLHDSLNILLNFFHAEGKGMALPSLYGPTYHTLERMLKLHMSDTQDLLEMFYLQRLKDQQKLLRADFGVLNVRIYFNPSADCLSIDVINARDVLPLDPNGFSDPFVIIELLPRHVFHQCPQQQTRIQKKTLNPIFDESFEFSVSRSQCKNEIAMIRFTVMDHDIMVSNDYAGEAYVSLSTVPGVDGVENKKIKHKELVLMRPNDKNNDIAIVLENRTWDKDAIEFM
ncbi:BAIAP3 (predicted), partial [Pycnogonum litorale]